MRSDRALFVYGRIAFEHRILAAHTESRKLANQHFSCTVVVRFGRDNLVQLCLRKSGGKEREGDQP